MKTRKRVLSILLTLALALGLLAIAPITAHAATGMAIIDVSTLGGTNADNSAAVSESQWNYIASSRLLQLTTASGNYTLTGTNADLRVSVDTAATGVNITLSGVDIAYPDNSEAFRVNGNNCTLTLAGNNTVKNTGTYIGINAEGSGKTTTVTSTSGGTLTVTGGSGNVHGFYIEGATLRITGNASVTAVGSSTFKAMTDTGATVFLGDNAKLTMTNNHASWSEDFVFGQADLTTTHKWKLTGTTLEAGFALTDDEIEVTVAAGQTATIEREPIVTPTYAVTVTGGTGSGSYAAGAAVSIAATVPAGKVFDKWTATGVTLSSPGSASTSFTMPANAVTVTASFKDAPASAKKIFTTKYDSNFWNWLLFIVCFGWIWMWFV